MRHLTFLAFSVFLISYSALPRQQSAAPATYVDSSGIWAYHEYTSKMLMPATARLERARQFENSRYEKLVALGSWADRWPNPVDPSFRRLRKKIYCAALLMAVFSLVLLTAVFAWRSSSR